MKKTSKLEERSAQQSDRVNLGKLNKLFKIIALLKSGRWTGKQIMDRLDLSKSTTYRYIQLLEDAGFYIEKDFHDRHFIVTSDDDPIQAHLTTEEMTIIRAYIMADTNQPLKDAMLNKLSLLSEIDSMPRLFVKAHLGGMVEQLTQAMRDKHQVILTNYHSANSNEIRDRHVEPIHFGDNYGSIMALDLDDNTCKQFKLDRIGEVIETHKVFTNEHLHQQRTSDAFGLAGTSTTTVTVKLSLRSFLLMREEYPLSQAYLKAEDDHYIFNGPVAKFAGIGRFVLGMAEEVEVIGPDAFKDFIRERIGRIKI